ncbi:hypothetical protein C8J56DRAFT_933184 [Mycena floridula]|nr:hypothetical protein C8J56DRAFT_933184 [Mycena floridula]
MSISLLGFPEELLHQIVLFLVDDADYEHQAYPKSLYHHVSSDIFALSFVNHQFRRICRPFVFSYLRCESLEELEKLERECLSNSTFTSFIRILDIEELGQEEARSHTVHEALLRLLPRLNSLVWLEFGDVFRMTSALITAIQNHPTLKTAVISSLPFDGPLPDSPLDLEKLLLHFPPETNDSIDLSVVQKRNIRVLSLFIDKDYMLPMETKIHNLREFSVYEPRIINDDQLDALVAHNPSLTKINVFGSRWEQCNILQSHISSFLDAVEAHSLGVAMSLNELALSPKKSCSKKGLDRWEATELGLTVTSSLIESLALAATMFPQLVSLQLSSHASSPIHVDSFISSISKHFPNLRVLDLGLTAQLGLVWTPLLIPLQRELSDETFDEVASRIRWLALHIFQASPSMRDIRVYQRNQGASLWFFWGSYKPNRDWSGALFGMKINSSAAYNETIALKCQHIAFHGSVVLSKMDIQFRR